MNTISSFEEQQQPLSTYSLKNLYFSASRLMIKTIGNLSDGIRLGNQYGFDSGVMLDYVYKNRASGRLLIGRLMDRIYLNSVGWRGIRLQRAMLTGCLTKILSEQLAHKLQVRYLDLACGSGDHDIEVLRRFPAERLFAELRDDREENLERAFRNARASNLDYIQFKQADAFNEVNYRQTWDVIVAPGLWESIDDDGMVRNCLLNAARCLNPGSKLVFTTQTYHPQIEFNAHVLTSHTGRPWVMRLRPLESFIRWMQAARLQLVSHRMEKHGIFGVVEAVKV